MSVQYNLQLFHLGMKSSFCALLPVSVHQYLHRRSHLWISWLLLIQIHFHRWDDVHCIQHPVWILLLLHLHRYKLLIILLTGWIPGFFCKILLLQITVAPAIAWYVLGGSGTQRSSQISHAITNSGIFSHVNTWFAQTVIYSSPIMTISSNPSPDVKWRNS